MNRPLIISDCDEVLLHMVSPFKDWLEESQGVDFNLEGANFSEAMRWQDGGELLVEKDVWRLLGGFFDTEMPRQMPIEGAVDAINTLGEQADIVILTNLVDKRREMRAEQLSAIGMASTAPSIGIWRGISVSKNPPSNRHTSFTGIFR